jgi:hypothetical protein
MQFINHSVSADTLHEGQLRAAAGPGFLAKSTSMCLRPHLAPAPGLLPAMHREQLAMFPGTRGHQLGATLLSVFPKEMNHRAYVRPPPVWHQACCSLSQPRLRAIKELLPSLEGKALCIYFFCPHCCHRQRSSTVLPSCEVHARATPTKYEADTRSWAGAEYAQVIKPRDADKDSNSHSCLLGTCSSWPHTRYFTIHFHIWKSPQQWLQGIATSTL